MIAFFKATGIIVVLFIATAVIAAVSPQLGIWVGAALLLLPAIALFKPIPKLKLGHRGFSLAVLLLVGLPATIASVGIATDQRESRFAALKESDPTAYLAAIKDFDQKRWLAELETMDPAQHATEVARIAKEEAQRREEERVQAEAKAAQKRAEECGKKNEVMAFVMSQEFVKRRLRAPATAEFPNITNSSSRAIGDCKFQVASYVDAQNGFGALLRSRYTATMLLHPEEDSWSAIELQISE